METEDELCARYEAQFAAIAVLDDRYYRTPCANLSERAAYAGRQDQLERTRMRFYQELDAIRAYRAFRPCRSLIRQARARSRR